MRGPDLAKPSLLSLKVAKMATFDTVDELLVKVAYKQA